jgi:hypothetical protein
MPLFSGRAVARRQSLLPQLLYLFPRSGQGFSFFQDQFLAEGAGFFAKPVLENFSSTGFDLSSPSPLPNKHNKKYMWANRRLAGVGASS